MSDLSLFVVKIGYLALLWVFVLIVAAAMRREIMPRRGRAARASARTATRAATPPQPAPAPAAPAAALATAAAVKPPRTRRGSPRRLAVTAGPLQGRTIELGVEPVTIGRAPDNAMVLEDDYASGHHARIRLDGRRWVVEDLGSTNGTYVGTSKVSRAVTLTVGKTIRIGTTTIEARQ